MEKQKYDVFISYRRALGGWAYARLIAELLKNEGFDVFLDVDILNQDAFGADFEKVITQALNASKVVVFVFVDHALDRCVSDKGNDVLEKEILLAQSLNKAIIPITNRSFEMPKGLNPKIVDLFKRQSINMDDSNWKKVVKDIVTTLRKLTGKKEQLNKPNKFMGILSVNNQMNYIIDYNISELDKEIQEKEFEVYKRNANKIFNSNKNDVELKVIPVKDNNK